MKLVKGYIKTSLFIITLFAYTSSSYAQTSNNEPSEVVVISAKDLYEGLKNKSLNFRYNQEIVITGILKETGSSFIYNSAYLLISDTDNGYIYLKAVLADKRRRSEYKKGQNINIRCRFYEERESVVVVKDAKNN